MRSYSWGAELTESGGGNLCQLTGAGAAVDLAAGASGVRP